MERMNGKIAIVTGAARGMGRATVELFVQEGASAVYATDLNPPETPFPDGVVHFSVMDVASESDWRTLVDGVAARHGAADVLINNAGIGGSQLALADENLDDWNRVIAVNQTGTFLGMRSVLPGMRARKKGSIVNFSSIWGISAVSMGAAYHASKAAIRHLTKHAAVAYAADNVRVNSIHPGIVATPMLRSQSESASAAVVAATPLGRMGQPSELANGVLFLACDESSFMTGAELVIDGGYLAQ